MALQGSGQIEISEIAAEFGGSEPHALSEYYGGGDLVPAGANPNVATSGESQMSDYYNAVAATTLTISSNTNNYNIKTAVSSAGGDQSTPVILTINAGVTVGSTATNTPAMKTDTGWSNGVTINITNNGSIVGASGSNTSGNPSSGGGGGGSGNGGAGSAGSTGSGTADSANNGGDAFNHSQTGDDYLSVIFDTAGTRTAGAAGTKTITGNGGGGGGGGRGGWYTYGGGGGGGGAAGGSGGSPGGSSGGTTSGGGGGSGGGSDSGSNTNWSWFNGGGGSGGSGGNLGSAGSSGSGGASRNNSCHGSSGGGPTGGGGSAGSNGSANGSAGSALSGNTDQIS